jgi:membrane associated rhomboid family serine protease
LKNATTAFFNGMLSGLVRAMFPLYDDNPSLRTPFVTLGLVAINVAVMVWLSLMPPLERQVAIVHHAFVPERIDQLTNPNLVVKVPIEIDAPAGGVRVGLPQQPAVRVEELPADPLQILASIISTMFLHGGWMHLAGNMWILWIFGNNVEDRLGSFLYLIFYLVGGLLATTCHWAYDPHSGVPVVGASGAVAAILGAYAVTFPRATVRTLIFFGFITVVDLPALLWLGLWFAGQLFGATLNRDLGVAVWAHIGGFIAGAALMPILSFGSPPPGSSWKEEIEKHFLFPPPDR